MFSKLMFLILLLGVWQRKKAGVPNYVLETPWAIVLNMHIYCRIPWRLSFALGISKWGTQYIVFYNYFDHANVSLGSIHGHLLGKHCTRCWSSVVQGPLKIWLTQEYHSSSLVRTSSYIWYRPGKGRLLILDPSENTFSSPLCTTVSFIPLLEVTIRFWYNVILTGHQYLEDVSLIDSHWHGFLLGTLSLAMSWLPEPADCTLTTPSSPSIELICNIFLT